MSAVRLAEAIEADLIQLAAGHLQWYFSRQLPPGRAAIIFGDLAEVEIRLRIREADDLPTGGADAYVILREQRSRRAPDRPSMYWYGLAQRLPTGDWIYEGFHLHNEPGRGLISHFQSELREEENGNPRKVAWERVPNIHAVPAVEALMARYYARLVEAEPEL